MMGDFTYALVSQSTGSKEIEIVTAQSSEGFVSYHPGFEPGCWRLFGIVQGEPSKENNGWGTRKRITKFVPRAAKSRLTSNWKGFTQFYALQATAECILLSIRYDDDGTTQQINETLQGDFFLCFKSDFFGPRLYVPFQDGKLVLERDEWIHEFPTGLELFSKEFSYGCHPDFPNKASC
jgi:hypothetical protein